MHAISQILQTSLFIISNNSLSQINMKNSSYRTLFRSYRIEQVMMIKIFKNTNLPNKTIMHKEFVRAIDIHRKAMELVSCIKVLYIVYYY
jgi:hypothetical protein